MLTPPEGVATQSNRTKPQHDMSQELADWINHNEDLAKEFRRIVVKAVIRNLNEQEEIVKQRSEAAA